MAQLMLTLNDLVPVIQIIDECRTQLALDAELRWSPIQLKEALASGAELRGITCDLLSSSQEPIVRGFVLFRRLKGAGEGRGDCAEILCLATLPESQGRGLMGQLLFQLQESFEELWLEVHEKNLRAIEFYKRKGFQQVGVRKRYYVDGAAALLWTWKKSN